MILILFHFFHFLGRDKITNFMHMNSFLVNEEDMVYIMNGVYILLVQ